MNQFNHLRLRLKRFFSPNKRTHYLYDGPYYGGKSSYSYYLDSDETRILDGPFEFRLNSDRCPGDIHRSVVRGSFVDGLKNGLWTFFYRSDDKKLKLTVNFLNGLIDGKVNFEQVEDNSDKDEPSSTKLSFVANQRHIVGEVCGLLRNFKFCAMLDDNGRPHKTWSRKCYDRENGEWRIVEEWNHGHLEKAERQMTIYGRTERINPSLCQQLNELIDNINNNMLSIVQHGSLGGLANIPAV